MSIILVSGIVSNLKNSNGSNEDFLDRSEKDLLGIGAIVAATLGESMSSTSLASTSMNSGVEMEFFTCSVGEISLGGSFFKVGFKNGQYINFAVDQCGGNLVQAAHDPSNHLIWTLPHRTKGNLAQTRSNVCGSIMASVGAALLLFTLGYFTGDTNEAFRLKSAILQACIALLLTLILCFFVCRRIYNDLAGVTLVFDALGFSKPSNVDLHKINRKAKKQYMAKNKEDNFQDVPWCFRCLKIE